MPDVSPDIPHVIAPPPLIYALPLAAGLVLNHYRPWPALPAGIARIAGPVCVLLGCIGFPAIIAFFRAGTRPEPWRPSTALVIAGPYRITRNPMYLGFALLYLGTSLWVNTAWPLLALPAVLLVMHFGVIRREEAYLERRFGDPYRAYRARVRRWI
jgi:protein-S-isoprenylcysteine O-methyltransferase Ste14